jgi:hypothetical protein
MTDIHGNKKNIISLVDGRISKLKIIIDADKDGKSEG